MSGSVAEVDDVATEWWVRYAVALFLLLPADLFTTLLAVGRHGTAVEANPVMRWLLEHGLVAVTVANLVAVGFAVWLFAAAVDRVRQVPSSRRGVFVRLVDCWLGLLIAAGVVLVANNVLALV